MKNTLEYTIILLSLLFIVWIIAPHIQHAGLRGFYNPTIYELKLLEWDYLTNGTTCFSYSYPLDKEVYIFLNNELIEKTNKKVICLNISSDSKITIKVDNKSVSFFVNYERNLNCPHNVENYLDIKIPIDVEKYGKYPLNITVFNGRCHGRVYRIKIFLDNSMLAEIPVKMKPFQEKTITYPIRFLNDGKHSVKVVFDGEEVTRTVNVTSERLEWKIPIGLIIFLALLLLFIKKDLFYGSVELFAITLAFLVLIPLIISLFNIQLFIPSFLIGIVLVMICVMKLRY